jgi:hypothetical protein
VIIGPDHPDHPIQDVIRKRRTYAVQVLYPFGQWTTEWTFPTHREATAKVQDLMRSSTLGSHRVRVVTARQEA